MEEKIAVLAMELGGLDEAERETVELFSRAAEAELRRRLREDLTPEDCEPAFLTAGACLALACHLTGQGGGEPESFSAGDLTIRAGSAERCDALRKQAERILAPYCRDDAFAFWGVRG